MGVGEVQYRIRVVNNTIGPFPTQECEVRLTIGIQILALVAFMPK